MKPGKDPHDDSDDYIIPKYLIGMGFIAIITLVVVFVLLGLFFLADLQIGEIERDADGLIASDRWERFSKEFQGTEFECLELATKDFWEKCPEIYGSSCTNVWDYTEVYTFIGEDEKQYCGMSIPKDYHIELIPQ